MKLKNHGYEFEINKLRHIDNNGNYGSDNEDFINLLDEFCYFVDNYDKSVDNFSEKGEKDSKTVDNSSFLRHFVDNLLDKMGILLEGKIIDEKLENELEELREWYDYNCECRYM